MKENQRWRQNEKIGPHITGLKVCRGVTGAMGGSIKCFWGITKGINNLLHTHICNYLHSPIHHVSDTLIIMMMISENS